MSSFSFKTGEYFQRIKCPQEWLDIVPRPTLATLAFIQSQHMREIPFENIDVVQRKVISMELESVQEKLLHRKRGGYCFEQNTLLQAALRSIGFVVAPLLCRVRWNKAVDEETTFTHIALMVTIDAVTYLVDVGFGGVSSIAPLRMDTQESQQVPDGVYRLQEKTGQNGLYTTLLWQVAGEDKALYMFRQESAARIDLELSNWWSCTYPAARFVTSFFVALVIGDDRHHILNNSYVIRKKDGSSESTPIVSKEQLLTILDSIFGLRGFASTDDLDRYL